MTEEFRQLNNQHNDSNISTSSQGIERPSRERVILLYNTPGHPTAYAGIHQLYQFYRGLYSRDEIRDILAQNEGYTLHREFRAGPRNITYKHFKRYQFQMDLVDVQQLASKNNNFRYLLNCIDIFTRYAFVRPVKDKKASNVLEAFKDILLEAQKPPLIVVMDKGTEFNNRFFKQFCQSKGIKLINPQASIHAAFIERFNRTLQLLMYKYMTENETERYIDVLQDLVKTYNKRKHRMIKMTPEEAEMNTDESNLQLNRIQQDQILKMKPKKPNLKVGTYVRIAKQKGKFARSYDEQTMQEIFKIKSVDTSKIIPMYSLTDYDGKEDIIGGFYEFELTPVKTATFRIEKVLKEKTIGGKKKLFVKWKGFSEKHNSWIDGDNVERKF